MYLSLVRDLFGWLMILRNNVIVFLPTWLSACLTVCLGPHILDMSFWICPLYCTLKLLYCYMLHFLFTGKLHSAGTLEGSNEGITSIEFDPTGTKVLAASYDKSALFWKLDDCAPKFTLTGHSRKVTSAKFKSSLRQAVTGSADRTVKIWDLQRAACVKTINVFSFCSDVVCSEYFIVSGHFDKKIRFWDSRAASCTQEVPLQGKVTSLEISPDHTQLLSCSRDECLQVIDLRMNNIRKSFRAEGFKCGSDWTKAIFSPDGSYVTAGSSDGAVYVWNVNSGLLETCLPEQHSSSVNAVSWSLSGEYVVSVDRSRRAVLWSDI
ncbi:protein Atg16l2-like isoform X1 [Polyodon spathula]|uniref:protein Atg16l2-like isoform X1 n=1 Tax=Polyodon spathula TaxID=7913 RepID=UPI001B7EFB48|nr:protein Atg16l2-like isoform X1 [Polyodon spathula]